MKDLAVIDCCTTCSVCVTACPVTSASRIYNGPKISGPSAQRFQNLSHAEIAALDYCSNCKNCDIACPNGISVSELNMKARAEQCFNHGIRIRDLILANSHEVARLARLVPHSLVRAGMKSPLAGLCFKGIGISGPVPVFAKKSFSDQFSRIKQKKSQKKVLFFPGCFINDYEPDAGIALVSLLNKAGYEVMVPSYECCGVPLVTNGLMRQAEKKASLNMAAFNANIDSCEAMVTACPSCLAMLKKEYRAYFPDVSQTERYSQKLFDAGQFLAMCLDDGKLVRNGTTEERFLYHAPCHLRVMGIGTPYVPLLKRSGADVSKCAPGCCGLSGTYGFKKEKHEVSIKVGDPLFADIKNRAPDCVLSECGLCRIQIQDNTKASTRHPLLVLDSMLEGNGQ